jgi:hypothetical protein
LATHDELLSLRTLVLQGREVDFTQAFLVWRREGQMFSWSGSVRGHDFVGLVADREEPSPGAAPTPDVATAIPRSISPATMDMRTVVARTQALLVGRALTVARRARWFARSRPKVTMSRVDNAAAGSEERRCCLGCPTPVETTPGRRGGWTACARVRTARIAPSRPKPATL